MNKLELHKKSIKEIAKEEGVSTNAVENIRLSKHSLHEQTNGQRFETDIKNLLRQYNYIFRSQVIIGMAPISVRNYQADILITNAHRPIIISLKSAAHGGTADWIPYADIKRLQHYGHYIRYQIQNGDGWNNVNWDYVKKCHPKIRIINLDEFKILLEEKRFGL